MFAARTHGVVLALILTTSWAGSVSAQSAKGSKPAAGTRHAGVVFRTDFGHPERMSELANKADTALGNTIDSGKPAGLIEAFEGYLNDVETEFGDAANRDVVRSRLLKVFRSVFSDPARTAKFLEGFKHFSFASTLTSKGLNARAISEVREARECLSKVVPADSFCLMPVDLYLVTALAENGDPAEALVIALSVVARASKAYGKDDEFAGYALVALGKAQMAAGDARQAEKSLREALGILANSLEIQPSGYLLNCNIFAESLLAQSKNAEVAEVMSFLEPQIRKLLDDQLVPPVLSAVMMRAKALNALGKFEESEAVLGEFPEKVQSMIEPGIQGRNLLEASVVMLENTDRAKQAIPMKKRIARIDAKLPISVRR